MRLRHGLRLLLVAGLGCVALSACRTNIGTAATVDGKSITESRVDTYIASAGPSSAAVQQAAQQGQTIQQKPIVVDILVRTAVYEAALRRTKGGIPSDADLQALHDEAVQRLLQAPLTGAAIDRALTDQVRQLGLTPSFAGVVLRELELTDAYIDRTGARSGQELQARVVALRIPVSVNPRYGKWDPATLQLDHSSGAGLPSFQRLVSSPSAVSAGGQ